MSNDWKSEFEQFIASEAKSVPSHLTASVMKKVRADLVVLPKLVFLKLFGVQAVAGALTLLVCPQFGLGPLGGGEGVMHFVMHYGSIACAIFCGATFLGSAALTSVLFLKSAERAYVYKTRLWQFPLLGVISVTLLMLGSTLVNGSFPVLEPSFVSFWLIGGVLTSYLAYQTGFKLQQRLAPGF